MTIKQFEPYYVSQTTTEVVEDILEKGTCNLTTYKLAMDLHLQYIEPFIDFLKRKDWKKEYVR